MRQPILYAEEMWRRQRLWVIFLTGVGVVMSILSFTVPAFRADRNPVSLGFTSVPAGAIWLAYVPAGLILGGLLLLYRRRNYVQATEPGLRVSNLLSSVLIDWASIRNARVQPLDRHFQDSRKRLVRPMARQLLPRPALYVRLRCEDPELAAIRKKLGSQLVAEDVIALPIPDPDAMSWEISSRLPDRTGANLGGQRRRKRAK